MENDPLVIDLDELYASNSIVVHEVDLLNDSKYVGFGLPFPFSVPIVDSTKIQLSESWRLGDYEFTSIFESRDDTFLVLGVPIKRESDGGASFELSALSRYSPSQGLLSVRVAYKQDDAVEIFEWESCGTKHLVAADLAPQNRE